MPNYDKLRQAILSGMSDANIEFRDLCHLPGRLGFVERVKGDHHIFTHERVREIVNLQPKGNEAKPYQVKQVRDILDRYRFGETDVD